MGFYYLSLEPHNEKIESEYCYLQIVKPENTDSKKGKKRTKEEIKTDKERFEKHIKTIELLDKHKYFNLYNNPIELRTMFDSFTSSYIEDLDKNLTIYRINPKSSKQIRESYYNTIKYNVWEFDVLNKITNKKELIEQLKKDKLIQKFFANYFVSKCYANEEYKEELYLFMDYIKLNCPNEKIFISDIIKCDKYPYERRIRDVYDITRENIRYAIKNNFVNLYKEYENVIDIVNILFEMKLFDVALEYIKSVPQNMSPDLDKVFKENQKLDLLVKNNTDDKNVIEIVNLLNLKISGVLLTVTKIEYQEYGSDEETVIEQTRFDNVSQVKSHLVKQYDVPFEELKKDVADIEFRPDEYIEYKFKCE